MNSEGLTLTDLTYIQELIERELIARTHEKELGTYGYDKLREASSRVNALRLTASRS